MTMHIQRWQQIVAHLLHGDAACQSRQLATGNVGLYYQHLAGTLHQLIRTYKVLMVLT